MTDALDSLLRQIAQELQLPQRGVKAVTELLNDANTVPFIARYRKEVTGGLDEVQIREIAERHSYLTELQQRKGTILEAIEGQGMLSAELRKRILGAVDKAELEDLYLPFKKKRKTRAAMARERGLHPLAQRMLDQAGGEDPRQAAAAFVDPKKGVDDVNAALSGARDVVAELVAERADVRAEVRALYRATGRVAARRRRKATDEVVRKFTQYLEFSELARTIPSHRYLAVTRGEAEGALSVQVEVESRRALSMIEGRVGINRRSGWASQLCEAIEDGFRRLLGPSLESELRAELKARSDEAAASVFAENLRHLLMAAPLGARAVLGIDPGLRTGCKCAAIDATGKFLEHDTLHLTRGEDSVARAQSQLLKLVRRHRPAAVGVGNGTGGREAEAFVRSTLRKAELGEVLVVSVNEAGASVYSASDVAREEFPDLDLTIRGAVSIARRLQDPLAELVEIDPKAIGVGQYQHDVQQTWLSRKLGEVVESCVNQVGVDLNTASSALLAHVSGIGPKLADRIVVRRNQEGPFRMRGELKKVAGLGPRAFEQCAGFLRIHDGPQPLDRSAVHPERYALVERMARDTGVSVDALIGDATRVSQIPSARYLDDGVGEPTLRDILAELEKPGRDPRASFEPPKFREDMTSIEQLRTGMLLQGVVTNVTAFGAFVDIGVHQDGLVHVSQLADHFVKSPSDVVKVGDHLQVRVLEVDLTRKRISLSARQGER